MKRLTTLLALAVAGTAQAGFESMMNPMGMANPMTMMVPMGMMAAPLGMGMMNPMGMGNPMGGMGALYPAMQMAPNLLSFGHNMNAMTNPYMGGPMQGNPFLQQGMPFAAPGWGAPQQAVPVSQMPFPFPMQAPQQAMPQQAFPFPMMAPQQAAPAAAPQGYPYMMQQPAPVPAAQVQGSTASGTSPMLFDPAVWLNMMNPAQAQPAVK